jgi:hypothetical protein
MNRVDVATMVPVDKVARIVVSDERSQEREYNSAGHITSLAPLPTTQFCGPRKDDLTGLKSGRFVVIGCAALRKARGSNTTRWVVRCSCGRYQIMTSKAVKKNHTDTMCVECRRTNHTAKLRMRDTETRQNLHLRKRFSPRLR